MPSDWKAGRLEQSHVNGVGTMQKFKIVTSSWDDGDPKDLRVAGLLRTRRLPGTFYVPITAAPGREILRNSDLRAINAEGFEIGAHTVSHKMLPRLAPQELNFEVQTCKQILEEKLSHEVAMFCYPNGRYNSGTVRAVERAGYRGARTTRMLSLRTMFPAFEMSTTLQAYPHPMTAYLRNQARAKSISGFTKYLITLSRCETWVDLGKRLFDEVLEYGGVWHIYGHSWEIEKLGIWHDLGEIFDYVANREGVTYATNGHLLSLVNMTDGLTPLQPVLEQCHPGYQDKENQTPCPR